jgi:alkaline phosphatase D
MKLQRRRWVGAAAAQAGSAVLGACAVRFPTAVPDRRFRVGIASCADQDKPQPVWDAVLADSPDFFVFGGDNVYASSVPFQIQTLRRAYDTLAAKDNFQRLRTAVPHLAVWDDHDYGANDAGAEFEHKQASKDQFLRFWNVAANDPRRGREGLYHAQVIAAHGLRIQIIGLDTRWFRSRLKPSDQRGAPGKERYLPDDDPTKTLLGEAQWRWLETQLREPAQVRLIVSSIQCIVEGHGWERWGNLPRERERLYRLIRDTGARGVILLSGDRHIGAIYRQADASLPYPLHEMTSSGATHAWSRAVEAGPNRLGELVGEVHYGVVEIDAAAQRITLSLRGLDRQVIQSHHMSFQELQIS